jgi:hypothetical protein
MATATRTATIGLLILLGACAQPAAIGPGAAPVDAIRGILGAIERHPVVALGEGNHGNVQGHVFRLSLIRRPEFASMVNDVVVEFGNARYQAVIDAFVQGEHVPDAELRKVWQNTTQAHPIWDAPIYEEFFREVRAVNATLPADRRLRVLLGDVPIDWDSVHSLSDLQDQPPRSDAFVAQLIRREVLDRNRRALVIFGDMHLLRRTLVFARPDNLNTLQPPDQEPSIVAYLEAQGAKVFSIRTEVSADLRELQPDIAAWQPPQLAMVAGTALGLARFDFYYPFPMLSTGDDGVARRLYVDPRKSPVMQEQYDAVLYLGPPSTITYSRPSPDLCKDDSYLQMRFGRMRLAGMEAQVAAARQYCASVR